MDAKTIELLKFIYNSFDTNKVKIKILKIEHQEFKDIITINMLEQIKSINKIKSIVNLIKSVLNTSISYYFNYNFLFLEIIKANNKTYNFNSYISVSNHRNKGEIFFGIDGAGQSIFKKIDSVKSLLISGSSGSGKSNLLHQLILSYLILNDNGYLMLIDPKHTELNWYTKAKLKNRLIMSVASEFDEALKVLNAFNNLITSRYKAMEKRGERFSNDSPILLVIDEYASLFTDSKTKKKVNSLISRIASLGRAARCYLIISTQHPTNENLTNTIRVNLQSKLALHCESAHQSINIINSSDAINIKGKGEFLLKVDGESLTFGKSTLITDELLTKYLKA